MAEDPEHPPAAGGGLQAGHVVADDLVAVRDAERADLLGEDLRRGQHVRARVAGHLDVVDVEMDGARNVLGVVLRLRVALEE